MKIYNIKKQILTGSLFLLLLVYWEGRLFSQTSTENYIISFTPDSAVTDLNKLRIAQRHPVVRYIDGLGRLKQTVSIQVTPSAEDLVQPVFYDNFGRESKTYLPFAQTNSGEMHSDPFYPENWQAHYAVEKDYTFSEKRFDNSPLNRVVEQAAPGYDWRMEEGHTVKIDYQLNVNQEVLLFDADEISKNINDYYDANQLYKTITKDENWTSGKAHTTEEFTNKQGQVVLKRSWLDDATTLNTYYVYDDYNLLRYVLPPKAFADGNTHISEEELKQLCYQYQYDGRKRMTHKKLPGADWVYMVYDRRDRLVAIQDGNQREDNKWLITKYDAFNRPVMTAFYSSSKNQTQLQDEVDDFYSNSLHPLYESRGGSFWSYDKKSFPINITDADVLSVSYYDNYSGIDNCPKSTYDPSFLSNSDVLATPKGQLAATWVKSLNADTGKNSGLWTVNFYDEKYRVVQSYAENYLGGYDYTTNAYDFVGKVDRTIHKHTTGTTNITESKWFTYDHAGRMLKIEQQYTGSVNKARTTIVEMEYDELGQLVRKNLPLVDRNLDYAYNIRGWMTQMNAAKTGSNSDFGFNLKYQSGATTFGGTNQFNGNIGAMEWWCSNLGNNNHHQAYGYQYDALNRITKADFRQNNSGWQNPVSTYDVDKITYDLNGNIQSLRRYGASSTIDDLAYTYSHYCPFKSD